VCSCKIETLTASPIYCSESASASGDFFLIVSDHSRSFGGGLQLLLCWPKLMLQERGLWSRGSRDLLHFQPIVLHEKLFVLLLFGE